MDEPDLISSQFDELKRDLNPDSQAWNDCYPQILRIAHNGALSARTSLDESKLRDCADEAVITVYQQMEKIRSAEHLKKMLTIIAKRRAIDEDERQSRAKPYDPQDPTFSNQLDQYFMANEENPAELWQENFTRSESKRLAPLLYGALETIGSPCHEIIRMAVIECAKHREIAAALGKGTSQIGNELAQCMKKWKKAFEVMWSPGKEALT